MGRIKKGFSKGSIVVCVKDEWQNGSRFITVGREYIVIEYWPKTSTLDKLIHTQYPRILIKEDRIGIKKLIPCSYFMPKDEFISKERDTKLKSLGL